MGPTGKESRTLKACWPWLSFAEEQLSGHARKPANVDLVAPPQSPEGFGDRFLNQVLQWLKDSPSNGHRILCTLCFAPPFFAIALSPESLSRKHPDTQNGQPRSSQPVGSGRCRELMLSFANAQNLRSKPG